VRQPRAEEQNGRPERNSNDTQSDVVDLTGLLFVYLVHRPIGWSNAVLPALVHRQVTRIRLRLSEFSIII
jgi:hypothetical protein